LQVRDDQWWRAISRGYRTQWAAMHPQQSDVFFYAHTLSEVEVLAPLVVKFRSVPGKKAYMVVTGGSHCPCEDAARLLGWTTASCHDRRFKIFDLEVKVDSSELVSLLDFIATLEGQLYLQGTSPVRLKLILCTPCGRWGQLQRATLTFPSSKRSLCQCGDYSKSTHQLLSLLWMTSHAVFMTR